LAALRAMLEKCGIAQAQSFNTRDLRRGHAQDLLKNGNCFLCISFAPVRLSFILRCWSC
jgi:hypothetical protein